VGNYEVDDFCGDDSDGRTDEDRRERALNIAIGLLGAYSSERPTHVDAVIVVARQIEAYLKGEDPS